jgi:hypothetical protein
MDKDKPSKSKLVRRVLGILLLVIVCGYATLLFAMNRAMHETPERFGRFMSKMPVAVFLVAPFETMWTHARAGALNVGDSAPDFTLPTFDKSTQVNLETIRKDRPVVLVFGSYT